MSKIIPDPFIDESRSDIGIEKMSITYVQPADEDSRHDDVQSITVESVCCPTIDDDELPYYYRIRTDKWSIDDPGQLANLLVDFIKRLSITTNFDDDKNSLQNIITDEND